MRDNAPTPIKIIIADDHEFTRTGLNYSLRNKGGFEIVGEAENGEEALALTTQKQPDIVLMDIGMPILDGIAATRLIKEQHPSIKVVILTSRQIGDEIYASLAAGADAYCMKDISTEDLVQVLEVVRKGGIWLDPAIARKVVSALPNYSAERDTKSGEGRQGYNTVLTEREHQVLELIAKGKSNKEIAHSLNISTHTVKIHVRNLTQKLAVDDRTQAAIKALQEGLIKTDTL